MTLTSRPNDSDPCALTSVDLHAVMQRAPFEEAERLRRKQT